eukprot:TRINITY_DN4174_c0_g1_i4.p1 TRINITY_DN4174_c0_g1~~TRINITY_DN4174_c0_g1_i4.p1  ORF type:complete len:144 (+),score=0.36 TRINITY_DN4174_c0_g1_i4:157-588(+)
MSAQYSCKKNRKKSTLRIEFSPTPYIFSVISKPIVDEKTLHETATAHYDTNENGGVICPTCNKTSCSHCKCYGYQGCKHYNLKEPCEGRPMRDKQICMKCRNRYRSFIVLSRSKSKYNTGEDPRIKRGPLEIRPRNSKKYSFA